MAAALHHTALFHDQDLLGIDDGGQAMRDDQAGVLGRYLVEDLLGRVLRLGVQSRRGPVEDQDLGTFEDHPGDGDALRLAP